MSVSIVRLDEVAEVRLGRQRSPKNHIGDGMRPYLRAANVGWDGLLLQDVKMMNFTDAEMSVYGLRPGDLLLNEASGSPHEVGKPAMWDGEIEGCAFQNTLLRVRPRAAISSRYLLHFFKYEAVSGNFADKSRGAGIRHLGREALAQTAVPLPPLAEQERIAEILDRADALRAKRRETLGLLDLLVQSIFSYMFGNSYEVVGLGDVVSEFRYGTSAKATGQGLPVLRIPNVLGESLDLSDLKYVPLSPVESNRLLLADGDLLLVRSNGNRKHVGRCAVFRNPGDGQNYVYASYLIRLRPDSSRVDSVFLQSFLSSPAGRAQLHRQGRTSAGQYNLSIEGLNKIVLPKVAMADQRLFARRVLQVKKQFQSFVQSYSAMQSIFDALQKQAFPSGSRSSWCGVERRVL